MATLTQPPTASFPALHLYPIDDSFIPKRIQLGGGQRVKIARPPNTKTLPGERNGYFDSRVLSRQHAEVWEEEGKIWIKDIKSANGTFLNGERLSPEGRESEPCELKTDDILEFGVDIVSEDNKTILHRKVVARVACMLPGQPIPLTDQYTNGRRSQQMPMMHQGIAGLGGMGGGVRVPGRGLTLDHIFSRLQAELAKSRDTGHDLQVLTGALNGIEDTLNGALVSALIYSGMFSMEFISFKPNSDGPPRFPDSLPPVRPPPARSMTLPALPNVPPVENNPQEQAISELQAQLREHQRALAAHVESIRALESVLAEQEAMKREVQELRQFVGVDRKDEEDIMAKDDDDDDARSIVTAVAHDLTLERVEELDEVEVEREENMRRERAQTPEPTFEDQDPEPSSLSLGELTARLTTLTNQLETALATSSELQQQHASAQATILILEEKLARLEAKTEPQPATPPPPTPPVPITVTLPSAELEEMQTQLAAMRAELTAERGRREAWAGAVDERIRLVTVSTSVQNGHILKSEEEIVSLSGSPPPAYIANGVIKAETRIEHQQPPVPPMAMQTAVGVLVLGIATAAVLWRVKPQ
ncbi:FHA domain-containing protein [Mycena indigotica]|uniref:FHA domain-containing protein n=1 Tax=Mycena indigotica TaxID=2126181 RepID=A0A8H6SPY8_9AGAR|nr:FHA domain-containing protein [Mycena indigotica]KAF7303688.1 FHA domain-containing protein [Mycena indigotica]